jgi:hypothetical protein
VIIYVVTGIREHSYILQQAYCSQGTLKFGVKITRKRVSKHAKPEIELPARPSSFKHDDRHDDREHFPSIANIFRIAGKLRRGSAYLSRQTCPSTASSQTRYDADVIY